MKLEGGNMTHNLASATLRRKKNITKARQKITIKILNYMNSI